MATMEATTMLVPLPNHDLVPGFNQIFITATNSAPDAVFLIVSIAALVLAVFRFRYAPGLAPVIAAMLVNIGAFSTRLYMANVDHPSIASLRVSHVFLLLGYVFLALQLVILKAEHFNVPHTLPNAYFIHRWRIFTWWLFTPTFMLPLFIIPIVYSALIGRQDIRGLWHAWNIIGFIYTACFFIWSLTTPIVQDWFGRLWNGTHTPTGVWLTFLTFFMFIPVIYSELRLQGGSDWVQNSLAAFYILWALPEIIVTVFMLMVPIGWWYPEMHSVLIW